MTVEHAFRVTERSAVPPTGKLVIEHTMEGTVLRHEDEAAGVARNWRDVEHSCYDSDGNVACLVAWMLSYGPGWRELGASEAF